MHVIAMRKSILDNQPWVARNLYNAFEDSKRRSLERILDPAVSRYPVPWLTNYAMRMVFAPYNTNGRDPRPFRLAGEMW